jgi:hypothetical protein
LSFSDFDDFWFNPSQTRITTSWRHGAVCS